MASDYITKFVADSVSLNEDIMPQGTLDTSHVLSQPSGYLRSRCPLCLGDNNWRQHRDPDTK